MSVTIQNPVGDLDWGHVGELRWGEGCPGSVSVKCNSNVGRFVNTKGFYLAGAEINTDFMGWYTEIPITAANEYPERAGRPVFEGPGENYLYYCAALARWYVSPTLGYSGGWVSAKSSAEHPMAITSIWIEHDGSNWVFAPNVTLSSPAGSAAEYDNLPFSLTNNEGRTKRAYFIVDGWKTNTGASRVDDDLVRGLQLLDGVVLLTQ